MPEEFKLQLDKLKLDLLSRDYNPKVISTAFTRIHSVKREDALKRVEKQEGPKRVPLVITYHPTLPSISKLARNHWNVMVENSARLEKIFPLPPVIAYKRSKNLRDILVKAKLPAGKRSTRKKEGFKQGSSSSNPDRPKDQVSCRF